MKPNVKDLALFSILELPYDLLGHQAVGPAEALDP